MDNGYFIRDLPNLLTPIGPICCSLTIRALEDDDIKAFQIRLLCCRGFLIFSVAHVNVWATGGLSRSREVVTSLWTDISQLLNSAM